jgi:ser/thr/tyr protein kinase RAD53
MAAGPPTEGLYAHYEVTEELGKGSFATVMKAMSKETGQWYAVKMIHMNHVKAAANMTQAETNGTKNKPDAASSLHHEVKILERLKHPNICQLKEVFYEEHYISTPYRIMWSWLKPDCCADIVLEWVPGGDLLEYILQRDGLCM